MAPLTPLLAIRSKSTTRLKAHPITPVKTSRPRIATAAAQHNLTRWKACSSHMLADREICVGAGGNNAKALLDMAPNGLSKAGVCNSMKQLGTVWGYLKLKQVLDIAGNGSGRFGTISRTGFRHSGKRFGAVWDYF